MKKEPDSFCGDINYSTNYKKTHLKGENYGLVVNLNNEFSNEHKITLVVDEKSNITGNSIKIENMLVNLQKRINEKRPKTFANLLLLLCEVAENLSMSANDLFDRFLRIGWLSIGIETARNLQIKFTTEESRVLYVIGKTVNETKLYSIEEDCVLEKLKAEYAMSREVAIGILNQLQKYSCIDIVDGKIILSEKVEIKTKNDNNKSDGVTIKARSKQK